MSLQTSDRLPPLNSEVPRDFRLEMDLGLDSLKSLLGSGKACYVAGPLDTGKRFYDALRIQEARDADDLRRIWGDDTFNRRVRRTNQEELTAFAERLRSAQKKPVIDPGLLRVPGWNGTHYAFFYLEVIRQYVDEIWFLDGWSYSSGATREFLCAFELQIPSRSSQGAPLTLAAGIQEVRDSLAVLQSQDVPAAGLEQRLTQLIDFSEGGVRGRT